MKRIFFLVFLLGLFISFPIEEAFALGLQADTTTAIPDDLVFEKVGIETEVDSAAAKQHAAIDSTKADSAAAVAVISPVAENKSAKTLWQTFLEGLAGGFLAFLMPCIFPMVPLTVSFFTKKAGSRQKAINQAIIYGLSIVVIYVVLGLLITLVFGSGKLNQLSTSVIFNVFFFLLLVVFAFSFFGAFEITLPSSIVNKIDAKADKSKGLGGIFFMAASLALVSFSCTGPIIGTLLVQASSKGEILAPAIGMFGFALALAFPFTLSAIFPGFLNSMPKSGGWLNSVKVCLGFLEVALALKFLSQADLVGHWNWFDREVFLVLWIVIFTLMGFYLLGKLMFSHDSPLAYISVPRLVLAMLSFAFAVYMVPGLWGAPLKALSALAPPMATQDFILSAGGEGGHGASADAEFPDSVKYGDALHAPLGFNVFFDLDEGIKYAKKANKPIMLDFTGHACVNCREMEANVWVVPEVFKLINKEYVLISLYVDESVIKVDPDKVHYSAYLKKDTKTLGDWNMDLQATRFNSNAQPLYVLTDHKLNSLVPQKGSMTNDVKGYISFLKSGVEKFKASVK